MTPSKLFQILDENHIPINVQFMSDSGWECGPTEMNGIHYNKTLNRIIFTQDGSMTDKWFREPGWKLIYGNNEPCQTCKHVTKDWECDQICKPDGTHMYPNIEDCRNCELYTKK